MRVFKIHCTVCRAAAIIRKTEWKDNKVADLYCACTNVECGHTFVFNAVYSHALSPSGLTDTGIVKALLERLTPKRETNCIGVFTALTVELTRLKL